MSLAAGTKLGRYQIEAVIGAGGMGVVYRAKDLRLRRHVAVKVLPENLAENRRALIRFEREAMAIATLSHPNILSIFDFGFHEGMAYAVTELLQGQNLKRAIQQHTYSVEEATTIALRIAEGLCAAHAKGVIHRDLKPENIFITSDSRVKILDFGLALLKPNISTEEFSATSTVAGTLEGAGIKGTVPYMSPEQLRGKVIDERSDIFSFGCVFYEMIAGRAPFIRETMADTVAAILHEDPFYDQDITSKQAHQAIPTLKSCLEKNPDQRIPDARHLVAQLGRLTDRKEQPTLGWNKQLPDRIKRKQQTLIGILSLIVLATIGYLLVRLPPAPSSTRIYSLAVLPLKNASGNSQDEYFADGITDEITSCLGRISTIRVISRNSAMQYKESKKNVKQICRELGVDAVLEGSVQREGSRIRLLANLIDANSSRNFWWSKSYEEEAKGVFGLQNELARDVVEELEAKLTPSERSQLFTSKNILPEAYDAYLRGLNHERKEDFSRESLQKEIMLFRQAVELEPGFANAYASLSRAYAVMYHFGFEPDIDNCSEAKMNVDRALEIEPQLPQGRLSLGYYYYWCLKDYNRALTQFGIARKVLPNDTKALEGIAYIQRREGNCESALSTLKKALILSPRDLRINTEVANTLSMLRQYKQADKYYDLAINLAPDQISPYLYKLENYYLWDGKTERADKVFHNLPPSDDNVDSYWIRQYLYSKDYASAISRIESTEIPIFDNQYGFTTKEQLLGSSYRLWNKPTKAKLYYEKARKILESQLQMRPTDPRILSSLGLVYAGLGEVDLAIEKGKQGAEIVPLERNYVEGIFRGMDLVKIYVITGRYNEAFDRLERLLAKPGFLSIRLIALDPDYEPLTRMSRFGKLSERPKQS